MNLKTQIKFSFFNSVFVFCFLCLNACSKDKDSIESSQKMNISFAFSETQERLDGFGNPSTIAQGNGAQTPDFNALSVYYIELVPTPTTPIRSGVVVYEAESQTAESGGNFEEAVKFDKAIIRDEGEVFLSLDLKDIPVGTYEYLRVSVTYQNGNVKFNLLNLPSPLPANLMQQNGTIASFIGFNTYINEFQLLHKTVAINGDRQQGFWAFEPQFESPYQNLYETYVNAEGYVVGQSAAGSTTVVNPLEAFGISLPFGSCIVTGKMDSPLTVTGNETENIELTLSFSINKSFEWIDGNGNNEWDFDLSTGSVEPLVDMGLRGLQVKVNP